MKIESQIMFKKILIANRGEIACRDAGVQGIYGPGSNIVECAADVLRLLGHNMPPVGE
jgi:methylmalonyl-CoA mutase cobalamin-binding subunit